jgi:hypothetical protein
MPPLLVCRVCCLLRECWVERERASGNVLPYIVCVSDVASKSRARSKSESFFSHDCFSSHLDGGAAIQFLIMSKPKTGLVNNSYFWIWMALSFPNQFFYHSRAFWFHGLSIFKFGYPNLRLLNLHVYYPISNLGIQI